MSGVLGEVHGRDVGPGQPDQLLVQSGTVALDHEHVVRAASVQVKGMLVLGVQSVLCRPPDYADVLVGTLTAHAIPADEVGIIRLGAMSRPRRSRMVGTDGFDVESICMTSSRSQKA